MPKIFSESDVKEKFITPAIIRAGWDELTQVRREVYYTAPCGQVVTSWGWFGCQRIQ